MYCRKCGADVKDADCCTICGNGMDPALFAQYQNKWYRKPLTIILLLLVFFPAGLYLMWKYADWKFAVKTGVSVFFMLVMLGIFRQHGGNDAAAVIAVQSSQASSESSAIEESLAVSLPDGLAETVSEMQSSQPEPSGSQPEPVSSKAISQAKASSTAPMRSSEQTSSQSPSSTTPTSAVSTIKIVSAPGTVVNNTMATLMIVGKPNTLYEIAVYYSSKSEAAGLEPKVSDADGMVTWTWKVGSRTKEGEHRIVITDGSEILETSFITVAS